MMPRQSARKTRDGHYEATKLGYYIARTAPFGYRKYKAVVGGKEHPKLEPDPDQWDPAVKMWEMGLEKRTPMEVATYNNSMGILNNMGNEWTDKGVREFFRTHAYKGETRRGMRQTSVLIPNNAPIAICENAHKAMVTPKQWNTVQGYIDERASAESGPRSISSPNPLSGKILCGECGSKMHSQRRAKGVRYLICSTKKNKGTKMCDAENALTEPVVSIVISELLGHILTEETIERQIKAVAKENSAFLSEQQANCKQLQEAQSRVRGQIKNLVDAIEANGGDPELYDRLDQRRTELNNLEAQSKELEEIAGDHLMFLNDPERIIKNALDLRTYLHSDDQHTVGLLLESFIEKVVLNGKTDGTIFWGVPLPNSGPSPATTQEIRFSDRGANKSYPLDMLVPARRGARCRVASPMQAGRPRPFRTGGGPPESLPACTSTACPAAGLPTTLSLLLRIAAVDLRPQQASPTLNYGDVVRHGLVRGDPDLRVAVVADPLRRNGAGQTTALMNQRRDLRCGDGSGHNGLFGVLQVALPTDAAAPEIAPSALED